MPFWELVVVHVRKLTLRPQGATTGDVENPKHSPSNTQAHKISALVQKDLPTTNGIPLIVHQRGKLHMYYTKESMPTVHEHEMQEELLLHVEERGIH